MDAVSVTKALMQRFLTGDPAAVRDTQQQLEAIAGQPGVAVALCDMAVEASVPMAARQLAGILLRRQVVDERWDVEVGREAEAVPEAVRAHLRTKLPAALGDGDSKIRTVIGQCIASMGSHDWPEQWPGLFDSLLHCITSKPGTPLFEGALRCMFLFIESISSDKVVGALRTLLNPMMGLAMAADHPPKNRRRALGIILSCLKSMGMLMRSPAGVKEVNSVLTPDVVAALFALYTSILASGDLSLPGIQLKTVALQVFMVFLTDFNKLLKPHVERALADTTAFMERFRQVYVPKEVKGGDAGGDSDVKYDSDGDLCGVASLAIQLVECVGSMCNAKGKFVPSKVSAALEALCTHCVDYSMLTASQLETWDDDVTAYIEEEEDEYNDLTPRACVATTALDVAETYGPKGINAVAKAVSMRIAAASALPDLELQWKTHESCMFVMGSIVKPVNRYLQALKLGGGEAKSKLEFDIPAFVKYLTQVMGAAARYGPVAAPYVYGRALWCGAKLCKHVPDEACVPFMSAAVDGLDRSKPIPVRMAACHALALLLKRLPAEAATPVLPVAIERTLALLHATVEAGEVSSLHLSIGALNVALPKAPAVAAALEAKLTPLFLALWLKFLNDRFLTRDTTRSLGVMISVPDAACRATVTGRLLPALTSVMRAPAAHTSGALEVALDLLRTLVQKSGTPVPEPLLSVLPVVMHILRTSDDHSHIETATDTLAMFVHSAAAQIAATKISMPAPGGGQQEVPGVQAVVMCVARCLDPSISDAASLKATKLVLAACDRLGPHMGSSVMADLIRALAVRLHNAEMLTMLTRLLTAFAHLLVAHSDAVVEVLKSVALQSPPAWAMSAYRIRYELKEQGGAGLGAGAGAGAAAGAGAGAAAGAGAGSPAAASGASADSLPPLGSRALQDLRIALVAGKEPHTIGGFPGGAAMTGLHTLLATWAVYQPLVSGRFERAVTCMGMCRLLTMPAVAAAAAGQVVKGDEVVDTSAPRAKRSDPEPTKYQRVPVLVRLAVMLARRFHDDVLQDQEEEYVGDSDDDSTDDGEYGGYDDDDDDDDDASAVDDGLRFAGPSGVFFPSEDIDDLADLVGGGDALAGMYAYSSDEDDDDDVFAEYDAAVMTAADTYLGAQDHPFYKLELSGKLKEFFVSLKGSPAGVELLKGVSASCAPEERKFLATNIG